MDEDGGGEHGNKVEDDLLVGVQQVEVDGVQTALGGGAGGEEQGIDVSQFVPRVDDDGGDEAQGDDVAVMEQDKIEVQIANERNAGLERIRFFEQFRKRPHGASRRRRGKGEGKRI